MVNGDNGEMKKICGNCKHWRSIQDCDVGKCLRITNSGPTSGNKAVVVDGEIGESYLVTIADFGCILFEPDLQGKNQSGGFVVAGKSAGESPAPASNL